MNGSDGRNAEGKQHSQEACWRRVEGKVHLLGAKLHHGCSNDAQLKHNQEHFHVAPVADLISDENSQ